MRFKNMLVMLIVLLFIFSLQVSCSSNKEKAFDNINKRVQKDRDKIALSRQDRKGDGPERQRQIAIADACSEKYNSCLANCDRSSCENECLKALSDCDKDLPEDLKTLKK